MQLILNEHTKRRLTLPEWLATGLDMKDINKFLISGYFRVLKDGMKKNKADRNKICNLKHVRYDLEGQLTLDCCKQAQLECVTQLDQEAT